MRTRLRPVLDGILFTSEPDIFHGAHSGAPGRNRPEARGCFVSYGPAKELAEINTRKSRFKVTLHPIIKITGFAV
jgi:hypothetical protein